MVERSEQGKLAPLPGKLLFARYSLAFAYRRIKFKQENSERIVIFPRKIAFFDFFINPERFRARKISTFTGKIAFRSLFFCYSIAFGLLFACSSQGHQNVQLLFARFKITPELLKKTILTLPNGCLTCNSEG